MKPLSLLGGGIDIKRDADSEAYKAGIGASLSSPPGDGAAATGSGKGGSVTKLSTGAAAAFEKSTTGACSSAELTSSKARRDLLKLPLSDPLCQGLCEPRGAPVRAALLSSCASWY